MRTLAQNGDTLTTRAAFVPGRRTRSGTHNGTRRSKKMRQDRAPSSSPTPSTNAYVLPHFSDDSHGTLLPVGPAYDTSGRRVDWRCADEGCNHERCKMSPAERKKSLVKARCLNGIEFGEALASALLAHTDISDTEHTSELATSNDSTQSSGLVRDSLSQEHDCFSPYIPGWDSPLTSLSPSPLSSRPSTPAG